MSDRKRDKLPLERRLFEPFNKWKEARSLDDLFIFRESEKSLKMTLRGSFFVCPYGSEKQIKVYAVRSYILKLENELRLCSSMWQGKQTIITSLKPVVSKLQSRGLVKPLYCQRNPQITIPYKKWKFINSNTRKIFIYHFICIRICSSGDSHFGGGSCFAWYRSYGWLFLSPFGPGRSSSPLLSITWFNIRFHNNIQIKKQSPRSFQKRSNWPLTKTVGKRHLFAKTFLEGDSIDANTLTLE